MSDMCYDPSDPRGFSEALSEFSDNDLFDFVRIHAEAENLIHAEVASRAGLLKQWATCPDAGRKSYILNVALAVLGGYVDPEDVNL